MKRAEQVKLPLVKLADLMTPVSTVTVLDGDSARGGHVR